MPALEDVWPGRPELSAQERVHVSVVCSPAGWARAEESRETLERERGAVVHHREFVETALFRGADPQVTLAALEEMDREGWSGTARAGRHTIWVSSSMWEWMDRVRVALSETEREISRTRLAGALIAALGALGQEEIAQEIAQLRLAQLSGL